MQFISLTNISHSNLPIKMQDML